MLKRFTAKVYKSCRSDKRDTKQQVLSKLHI